MTWVLEADGSTNWVLEGDEMTVSTESIFASNFRLASDLGWELAINRAIASVTGPAVIELPSGILLFTGPVTIDKSAIHIKGNASYPACGTHNFNFFQIPNTLLGDIVITDLFFEGGAVSASPAYCIDSTCSRIIIQNIKWLGVQSGIAIRGGSTYIKQVEGLSCTGTHFLIDQVISETVIINNAVCFFGFASFQVNRVSDLELIDCQGIASQYGLYSAPTAGHWVASLTLSNFWADHCTGHGIFLDGTQGGFIQRVRATSIWSASNKGHGAKLLSVQGSIWSDVQLFDNNTNFDGSGSASGMFIDGDQLGCTINSVHAAGNQGYGIRLGATAKNITISGGSRLGPAGGFGVNNIPLVIDAGASHFTITGNDFTGNSVGPPFLGPALTATEICRDNVGDQTSVVSTATVTSDGSGNITIPHGLLTTPSVVLLSGRNCLVVESSLDATNIHAKVYNPNGTVIASTSVTVRYEARM